MLLLLKSFSSRGLQLHKLSSEFTWNVFCHLLTSHFAAILKFRRALQSSNTLKRFSLAIGQTNLLYLCWDHWYSWAWLCDLFNSAPLCDAYSSPLLPFMTLLHFAMLTLPLCCLSWQILEGLFSYSTLSVWNLCALLVLFLFLKLYCVYFF